jgi:uncharacterized protein
MPPPFTRRKILAGILSSIPLSYSYGRWHERHHPQVIALDMPVPDLPPELDGLRVVQLSDLHLGEMNGTELMQRVVQKVQTLSPDLMLLTGDFVTESADYAAPLAEILKQVQPTLGSYASLGNHDVWTSARKVSTAFRQAGIPMLVNQALDLQHRGKKLLIGGLDSAWAGKPKFADVVKQWSTGTPLLLMAHEPDYADELARHHVPLVQLAGHTHGGQVRVPWMGAIRTVSWGKKYIAGRYAIGPVNLYVNRGVGCVGHPVRFASPPEITLLTLRSENRESK